MHIIFCCSLEIATIVLRFWWNSIGIWLELLLDLRRKYECLVDAANNEMIGNIPEN